MICASLLLLWFSQQLTAAVTDHRLQLQALLRHAPLPASTTTITEFVQLANQVAQLHACSAPPQNLDQPRLYHDPLSGLGNRLLLQTGIDQWIQRGSNGVLMLLRLPFLNQVLQRQHEAGYRRQCQQLKQHLQQVFVGQPLLIARLQQDEIAVLVTEHQPEQLPQQAEQIIAYYCQCAEAIHNHLMQQHRLIMLHASCPHDPSAMLAKLDNLLVQSNHGDHRQAVICDHNSQAVVRGRQQWVELVRSAMLHDQVVLKRQASISRDGELLHYELLSQLQLTGESCRAGQFIPPLEACGVVAEFDRFVVSKVFEILNKGPEQPLLAINLSPCSLGDAGFLRWLKQQLHQQHRWREQLLFEIPEAAFFQHKEAAMLFCELLAEAEFQFAIDHFGRHQQQISYLTELPMPRYVKLDYLFSQRLHQQEQQQQLKKLCHTTKTLGLPTIATRIENSDQLSLFQQLEVDGIQGYISYNWEEAQLL
ncbi:EAL domain-containing protein [Ferrimonas senticii]|uniref:EAL domain-containing protein n=1 Tax=Ferrimonas senticii TaxID=394566 RepID=UPI000483F3CF|nr:GGDEF domain-containing protein [Ferrimonas senticii]